MFQRKSSIEAKQQKKFLVLAELLEFFFHIFQAMINLIWIYPVREIFKIRIFAVSKPASNDPLKDLGPSSN